MFVVEGEIEIEVHNSKGECCVLDVLKQGDVIGQYSILKDTGYKFDANAFTNVKVFVLTKEFLLNHHHKAGVSATTAIEEIEGLSHAMTFANELVLEEGVPI